MPDMNRRRTRAGVTSVLDVLEPGIDVWPQDCGRYPCEVGDAPHILERDLMPLADSLPGHPKALGKVRGGSVGAVNVEDDRIMLFHATEISGLW